MRKQGSRVINCTMDSRLLVPDYTKNTVHWPDFDKVIMKRKLQKLSEKEKKEYIEQAKEELEARFQGKNGDARDSKAAFTGKKEGKSWFPLWGWTLKRRMLFSAPILCRRVHTDAADRRIRILIHGWKKP